MKKAKDGQVDNTIVLSTWPQIWNTYESHARLLSLGDDYVKSVRRHFDSFIDFMTLTYGSPPDPWLLPPDIFFAWLMNRGYSKNTVRTVVTQIRFLIKLSWESRVFDEYPPVLGVRLPSAVDRIVDVLTVDELLTLNNWLYSLPDHTTILRDRVIFRLLHLGIRSAELRSIKWSDLKLSRNFTIKTKYDRTRTFPIDDDLHSAVDAWGEVAPKNTQWLLRRVVYDKAVDTVPAHNTFMPVYRRWFKLGYKGSLSGVVRTKYYGPHLFRHSLATILFIKTRDIREVQAFLGHTNEETTWKYVHVAPSSTIDSSSKIRQAIYSPREATPLDELQDVYRKGK
jgi:integrase/recombinase XerC